jgi:hypothetical protein
MHSWTNNRKRQAARVGVRMRSVRSTIVFQPLGKLGLKSLFPVSWMLTIRTRLGCCTEHRAQLALRVPNLIKRFNASTFDMPIRNNGSGL